MKEKRYRTLLKTISWRLTGTMDTFLISFLITGKIALALSISGVEVFTKMILYYFHERTWSKVKYGLEEIKRPEYYI